MQTFDVSEHYLLLQAFDRAGRHMFGEEWTGIEAWARHVDDPELSKSEKNTLSIEIISLKKQLGAIQPEIEFANDDAAKQNAQETYLEISQKLRVTEDHYRHFPASYDHWIADSNAYKRKTFVEQRMLSAFSKGDLTLIYRGGTQTSYEEIRLHSGFKINIALSQVRLPSRYRSTLVQCDRDSTVSPDNPYREPLRFAAFVKKRAFLQWRAKQKAKTSHSDDTTLEEQAEQLLDRLIHLAGDKVVLRDPCMKEFKTLFPALGVNAFKRVWINSTSKIEKTKGRPPEESKADIGELLKQPKE